MQRRFESKVALPECAATPLVDRGFIVNAEL
jgi:hypothetical protein